MNTSLLKTQLLLSSASILGLGAAVTAQGQDDPASPPPATSTGSIGDTSKLPGGGFSSPGMFVAGQTTRFSSIFNPALGTVIDAIGRAEERDTGEDDGFAVDLRTLELNLHSFIDPNLWGYAVIVYDDEEVAVEEAAVQYIGWNSNSTLRAGRFFVDFGKQMQAHIHDLPYVSRPSVLRAYLGEELGGTGLQYDNWFSVGDETIVRYSLGVFDNLASHSHDEHGHGGEEHGDEEGEEHSAEIYDEELRQGDELGFTARLTGLTDIGDESTLQLGLSGRFLPSFSFEDEESGSRSDDDLSNTVWGLDATYGWVSDTGQKDATISAEYLMIDGDINGEYDEVAQAFDVYDGSAAGYYVWAEYGWTPRNAAGLLYSQFEHTEEDAGDDEEIAIYYSWNLSEFSRLRFQLEKRYPDEGPDETLFLVQFTNFFGAHAHGVNW